ncbi:MAG: PEP-CTERM sorting domain-containing protein [Anaerohalosphaeraceae bacterium]|nr:PEP-CTERM sorting domain-containing protein [Anaerohalosphaeraceae bacterium]
MRLERMRNLIVLAVVSCIVLVAAPASATLYETDFEDFTIGDVDGQDGGAWVVNSTSGRISDSASDYPINGKSLIVQEADGADGNVSLFFDSAPLVDISFDVGDCSPVRKGKFKLYSDATHYAVYISFYNDGFIHAWDGKDGSTGVGRINTGIAYSDYDTTGISTHIQIVADGATKTYDLFIDDSLICDDYRWYHSSDSINELNIQRDAQNSSNRLIVDNIVVVPEPATMLLLSLGTLVLRRRKA